MTFQVAMLEALLVKLVSLRINAVTSNDYGSQRNFATEFVNTTQTPTFYDMKKLLFGQECKLFHQIRKNISQGHNVKSG